MGFTDYTSWPGGGGGPSTLLNSPLKQQQVSGGGDSTDSQRIPDQEVLESIEAVYLSEDPDTNVQLYELQKLEGSEGLESGQVSEVMRRLRSQHKVVSKKVMQMILEQRGPCNEEFMRMGETSKLLEESVWLCRKSRSYLNYARKQLTTSNLEILATYKKRQVLQELLQTLHKIKEIVSEREILFNESASPIVILSVICRRRSTRISTPCWPRGRTCPGPYRSYSGAARPLPRWASTSASSRWRRNCRTRK